MGKASKRDRHRAALAAAIGKLTAAERDLQVAIDAKSAASDRQDEAQERLEALRNPGEDGEGQPDLGAVFAASVRAGAPCDATVLERPAAKRKEAIERAERDVDIWTKTYEACKSAIPAKQLAVDDRNRAVQRAAADVVQNAGVTEGVLAGLADLEAQVVERRLVLHFLQSRDLIADKDKASVKRALAQTDLPGDAYAASFTNWRQHPAFITLARAFEELKRDADAPLPAEGSRQ